VSRCKWPPCELMRSRPCRDGWFAAHAGKGRARCDRSGPLRGEGRLSGTTATVIPASTRLMPTKRNVPNRSPATMAADTVETIASRSARAFAHRRIWRRSVPADVSAVCLRAAARCGSKSRRAAVAKSHCRVVRTGAAGTASRRTSDRNAAGDWPEREIGESGLSLQVPAAKGK
jgi:hypothetical protein